MRISRLLIVLAPLALLVAPQVAQASESQNGADMVIINPGGGQEEDGSDGLLSVFNGEDVSSPNFFDEEFRFAAALGSDEQFFASTPQWCCSGVSPMLYAGPPTIAPLDPDDLGSWPAPASTLVGEAGAAYGVAPSWSTTGGGVEIVSTSGAVVRVPAGQAETEFPAGAPTGSGSAVIRYTAIVGGLTYVIERSISYTYPNNFFNETYTFTVPPGNTDPVEFYLGGDAAPGDSDNGRGAMTTSPNRVLYEINPDSEIFIAYGEVGSPAISPFSSGYVAAFDEPAYYSIERGYSLITGCGVLPSQQVVDTNFCLDNDEHDAGLDIQWTIPATPGTYTRQMRTIVGFQGMSVSARFTPSSVSSGQSSNLEIELVNTAFDPVSGVGFSLALPAGLTISGAATNSCDGTLTAASAGTSVALTGGDVASGDNCLVSVPVTGTVGSYTVYDQDFEDLVPLSLTKGFGNSSLEITGSPTPPGRPNLRVFLETSKKAIGGRPFSVKVKVSNRQNAGSAAEAVKSCLRVPSPLAIVRARGGKVSGRTVCWTRSSLAIGKSVTYPVTLKAPLSTRGRKSLRASVEGDNAAGQSSSASGRAVIGVRKGKVPKPQPPTG